MTERRRCEAVRASGARCCKFVTDNLGESRYCRRHGGPVYVDARFLLWALNRLNKPMYQGTVPRHVKARRRARNKVARISRRRNRVA